MRSVHRAHAPFSSRLLTSLHRELLAPHSFNLMNASEQPFIFHLEHLVPHSRNEKEPCDDPDIFDGDFNFCALHWHNRVVLDRTFVDDNFFLIKFTRSESDTDLLHVRFYQRVSVEVRSEFDFV